MKTLPLSKGLEALVDDEDYELVRHWKWSACANYAIRRERFGARAEGKYRTIYMHRFILGLANDDPRDVDHINRNRWDNRRENLRVGTHAQNLVNTPKRFDHPRTTSRFKGVSKLPKGKWRARVMTRANRTHLGVFATEEEAAVAYDREMKKRYGEFAVLNFP